MIRFQTRVSTKVAEVKKTMKGVVLSTIQLKIKSITVKITNLLSVNLKTNAVVEQVLQKLGVIL